MYYSSIQKAAALLSESGIVAYLTEYCYGLGCDPMNYSAVKRLLNIKRRHWSQGLILIAADLNQLGAFIDLSSKTLLEKPCSTWPGPYTWLLPALNRTPRWIRGHHDSVAVRISNHPTAIALCRNFGAAIVSTSANKTGRPPLRTHRHVRCEFGTDIDFILDGSVGKMTKPSTIQDAISGALIR